MTDPLSLLESLHRPGLLIRAARIALAEYNRAPRLRRLLKCQVLPGAAEAALRLMEMEAELDHARQARDAAYSPARHVEVLSALMHEARQLRARRAEAQAKASASAALRLVM